MIQRLIFLEKLSPSNFGHSKPSFEHRKRTNINYNFIFK